MQITEDDVIKRLEQLGYTPDSLDLSSINYCIHSVTERITNCCNIEEIPDNFKYEAIDAVCADFLGIKLACGTLPETVVSDVVSKIQEGDTTVEFEGGESSETKLKTLLDGMVLQLHNLNRFRRMVW